VAKDNAPSLRMLQLAGIDRVLPNRDGRFLDVLGKLPGA
jgi:hypothetical protein